MAWKFVSVASDLCQTLGYHRLCPGRENGQPLRGAQERLFWTVYAIEKGLSLRLGRSSNIRDTEITLPFNLDEPRSTKLGRINGMVYDQLYSPASLSRPDDERSHVAEALARDLRELINETHAEISVCFLSLHKLHISLTGCIRMLAASRVMLNPIRCESSIFNAT